MMKNLAAVGERLSRAVNMSRWAALVAVIWLNRLVWALFIGLCRMALAVTVVVIAMPVVWEATKTWVVAEAKFIVELAALSYRHPGLMLSVALLFLLLFLITLIFCVRNLMFYIVSAALLGCAIFFAWQFLPTKEITGGILMGAVCMFFCIVSWHSLRSHRFSSQRWIKWALLGTLSGLFILFGWAIWLFELAPLLTYGVRGADDVVRAAMLGGFLIGMLAWGSLLESDEPWPKNQS